MPIVFPSRRVTPNAKDEKALDVWQSCSRAGPPGAEVELASSPPDCSLLKEEDVGCQVCAPRAWNPSRRSFSLRSSSTCQPSAVLLSVRGGLAPVKLPAVFSPIKSSASGMERGCSLFLALGGTPAQAACDTSANATVDSWAESDDNKRKCGWEACAGSNPPSSMVLSNSSRSTIIAPGRSWRKENCKDCSSSPSGSTSHSTSVEAIIQLAAPSMSSPSLVSVSAASRLYTFCTSRDRGSRNCEPACAALSIQSSRSRRSSSSSETTSKSVMLV
mmetsp:Transcript_57403/g.134612  ORF Transcript_57403/g.134612 Transcript_57403/m.134612 type:complete len:274 (+) Transcript_57403:962-1783(+)